MKLHKDLKAGREELIKKDNRQEAESLLKERWTDIYEVKAEDNAVMASIKQTRIFPFEEMLLIIGVSTKKKKARKPKYNTHRAMILNKHPIVDGRRICRTTDFNKVV